MPRKQTSKGRARQVTPKSKLLLEIEKANRKLRSLEKGGEYGKYASKTLLRLVVNDNNFSYKRGRRNKIRLSTGKKLSQPNILMYVKKFREFIKSATSSLFGIQRARRKAEKKLRKTLGGLVNHKISQDDLDEFYDLVNDKDFKYMSEKIGDSEAYVLVQSIKENNLSLPEFRKQFSQFFDTNNFDFNARSKRLYNKIIKEYIPYYDDKSFEEFSNTFGEHKTLELINKAVENDYSLEEFQQEFAPLYDNPTGFWFKYTSEQLYKKIMEK